MRRARLILVLVALAVALPVGLLVLRALRSAEAEERAQRQALADTAFASVERELAALLAREEGRAWDEWRHLRVPEGAVSGSISLARSPLADLPAEDWNLGWFQVEPDGTVGTPFVPDAELARTLQLPPPPARALDRDSRVRELVSAWLASRPARPSRPAPAEPTVVFAEEAEPAAPSLFDRLESLAGRDAAMESAPAAGAAAPVGALEDTDSSRQVAKKTLGKGGYADRRREERAAPQKAEVFQQQAMARTVQDVASNSLQLPEAEEDPAELQDESRLDEAAGRRETAAELGASRVPPPLSEAKERATESETEVDVVVEPFVGELDPQGRLVLHRLVVVGGTTDRQGLGRDVGRLADAVTPLDLLARTAGVGGAFSLTAVNGAAAGDGLERRLPPPFDSLRAVLRLGATAGVGARRLVLALAALVGVFGLAGLIGLERMIAARFADAQRRSDFVSAVTHELKTPLAAIRLHGEMLREGIAATEQKRADSYRTITAECERLTRLVDNVLELSRLEKGTRSVSLVAGPIVPVLREALELLEPHARASGFALELDCDDALAARFDRDALLQVVFNLVDNAIKYSREAEDKTITLNARAEDGRVALLVRDRGPGVPARQLARIFEPFWRGERELTRRTKGTGIGLALVQGLVERMGGEASGRNAEGGGFEARIVLPGTGS